MKWITNRQMIEEHFHIYYDEEQNNFRITKKENDFKPTKNDKPTTLLLKDKDSCFQILLYDYVLQKETINSFHRLKYAWYHDIPEGAVLKHINGIKTDNRLSNLKVISRHNFNKETGSICKTAPLPKKHDVTAEVYLEKLKYYIWLRKRSKDPKTGNVMVTRLNDAANAKSGIHRQKGKLLNFMTEDEYEEWFTKLENQVDERLKLNKKFYNGEILFDEYEKKITQLTPFDKVR